MRRTLAIASTVLLLGVVTSWLIPAQAQQPAAPPPWKQGQPAELANSPLAPVPQPPAPKAPGEIPVDKIKVPPGFKVELWAHGINNARVMTWGSKGTLFVSSRVAGNVYAVLDKGGTREVKTIAKGLNLPNGVAFKDGVLYVAEIHRITKMVGIEDKLDSPPPMEVVYETLPKDAPTAGSTWRSGRTASCTSTSARPATSASPPTPTPTSRASTRTAPVSNTGPTACATASASTGIR
jgi:glucose/arabinose dehydrogenase